jgi:carbamate kinase
MGNKAKKVVVALGGNALQEPGSPSTAEAQLAVVQKTCGYLEKIHAEGYEMGIVHGNGPQVGRLALSLEVAETTNKDLPAMPFDVCNAMTQGYIGYQIQQSLNEAIRQKNRSIPVVTLVTQVVVDANDAAFNNPTKPIGPFYTEEEAEKIRKEKGFTVKEDAGRGWRRMIASPEPKRIVEIDSIRQLWGSNIVILAGGGGIPVVENSDGSLSGIAAVIDKDLSAGCFAEAIEADVFLILTGVERVCLNYGKENQKELSKITVAEAKEYIEQGHFPPGSMLPKIIAGINFASKFPGKKAIITSLYRAIDSLEGKTGTEITL